MQAKIKDQQKGKQSNKQSLVRPNKVSLAESPSYCGGRDVIWWWRRLVSCLLMRGVVCWEGFLELIIKLWLMFRSRHLVLWSLGTYGLRESWVRDWLCKGKTDHPQCTLPKVSCIVVWLFFSKSGFYSLVFSRAQGRSLFMRESLPYRVKS